MGNVKISQILFLNDISSFTHLDTVTTLGVLVGSLAGATIFILGDKKSKKLTKVVFFYISFVSGIISSRFSADLISTITPQSVVAEAPMGALISAAVAVKFIKSISKFVNDWLVNYKDK